jgi:hypothetical protein
VSLRQSTREASRVRGKPSISSSVCLAAARLTGSLGSEHATENKRNFRPLAFPPKNSAIGPKWFFFNQSLSVTARPPKKDAPNAQLAWQLAEARTEESVSASSRFTFRGGSEAEGPLSILI